MNRRAAVFALVFMASCGEPRLSLPGTLAGIPLGARLSGEEAREVVDRLHGKEVTPLETMIGRYEARGATATLYLSVYSSAEEAHGVENRMAALIEGGTTSFSPVGRREIQGRAMVVCSGMGQEHFFFSQGGCLYWLAVDGAIAHRAAADLGDAVKN